MKSHNWIVQLCDYHAIKYSADYSVHQIIKDALKAKDGCVSCKLDMPINIERVDIILMDKSNE